jgi:hypothetical protein
LNITCNFLYCNHRVHRDFSINLYKCLQGHTKTEHFVTMRLVLFFVIIYFLIVDAVNRLCSDKCLSQMNYISELPPRRMCILASNASLPVLHLPGAPPHKMAHAPLQLRNELQPASVCKWHCSPAVCQASKPASCDAGPTALEIAIVLPRR